MEKEGQGIKWIGRRLKKANGLTLHLGVENRKQEWSVNWECKRIDRLGADASETEERWMQIEVSQAQQVTGFSG